MKVLIVGNSKVGKFLNKTGRFSAFITEQAADLEKLGVEIDYFGVSGKGFWGYLKCLPGLKRKIKDFKPDIVHAHFGLSGVLACLQRKAPVIITFHNGETLNKYVNFMTSLASLTAVYNIYVAEHIYKKLYFKRKNRYTILPCAVALNDCKITPYDEARKELNFDKDKKYILFGGAFDNLRKNYELLDNSVRLINRDDIVCLEMKNINRTQISLLMSGCDLFALPSKSEGSPQALKEAMACNCPIIATDIADIRHLLGDLPGHFICDFNVKNTAELLEKALMFKNRTHGRERIIALGLDSESVAKKILDIYNELCILPLL